MKDIIFASCDSEYYLSHAQALINSCAKFDKHLIIEVINPTEEVCKAALCSFHLNVSHRYVSYNMAGMTPEQCRILYSIHRFLTLPILLQEGFNVLVVDIDCYIVNDFNFPISKKLGLFLRDSLPGTVGWEREGTKVAAGMVYVNSDYVAFANLVVEKIKSQRVNGHGMRWFVDQWALHQAYLDMNVSAADFMPFDQSFMDWTFKPDSIFWTGKGDRKYTNKTYVSKKQEIELDG